MLAEAIRKPDVQRYIDRVVSEDEYMCDLYRSAESLIDGALAIAEQGREEGPEELHTISDLLKAFKAVMGKGSDAIDNAKRRKLPNITLDELKEKLGDVGDAEVKIGFDVNGFLCGEQYHLGKKYRHEPGKGFVEVSSPKASGKKKGNGKGKAA